MGRAEAQVEEVDNALLPLEDLGAVEVKPFEELQFEDIEMDDVSIRLDDGFDEFAF